MSLVREAGRGAGSVVFALLRRRLVAVTVRGASMEPAFHDGDRVLVHRDLALRPGNVVVVERPTPGAEWHSEALPPTCGSGALSSRTWMIKRVSAAPGDPVPTDWAPVMAEVREERVPPDRLILLGDNKETSFDSRHVGYFPVERVLGAVLRSLPR